MNCTLVGNRKKKPVLALKTMIGRIFPILVFSSAFFFWQGCATAPPAKTDPLPAPEPVVAEEPGRTITSAAVMNTAGGTPVKSVDGGTLVSEYDGLPDEFSGALVVRTEHEYYYRGETLKSRFELVYSGISGTAEPGELSRNDILGYALGSEVSLTARTREIDPYLISCSNVAPVRSGDYWYYFPGMYIPTEMKWLSFKPVEYDEFKSMYDHATTGEEALGMTMFNWWSLYETTLDAYPQAVEGKNGTSVEQVISFGDIPLRLRYQDGFLQYLLDEYVLGEPIFLYLQIRDISGFTKEYNCYVRDFSLTPPEVIVQKRLGALEG